MQHMRAVHGPHPIEVKHLEQFLANKNKEKAAKLEGAFSIDVNIDT